MKFILACGVYGNTPSTIGTDKLSQMAQINAEM